MAKLLALAAGLVAVLGPGSDAGGRAPLTGPVRTQVVGFSPGSFVLDLPSDELAADLDAVVDAGGRWLRVDVDWSRVEYEPGSYDWDHPDAVIEAARARGLAVLALVAYTPAWARPA